MTYIAYEAHKRMPNESPLNRTETYLFNIYSALEDLLVQEETNGDFLKEIHRELMRAKQPPVATPAKDDERASDSAVVGGSVTTADADGKFTCPTCGKQFSHRLALSGHMTSHKKEAPETE